MGMDARKPVGGKRDRKQDDSNKISWPGKGEAKREIPETTTSSFEACKSPFGLLQVPSKSYGVPDDERLRKLMIISYHIITIYVILSNHRVGSTFEPEQSHLSSMPQPMQKNSWRKNLCQKKSHYLLISIIYVSAC
jgi:hypothetical protein